LLGRTSSPIEFQLVGRTLLHSILVGAVVGLAGSLLYRVLELVEHGMLEHLAGYEALRAAGEELSEASGRAPFRPWLLAFLPAVGALFAGLIAQFIAPETAGGGTDTIIRDFHENRG